jgi:cytidylate kinase
MKWITFSRKLGANGSDLARKVATELGYRFYDTEAITHMAQALGFPESVREADEKVPSIFQRLFSHKPTVYFDRLYSVIYELAKQGDAVFLGRGSHILLKAFDCALHVRVIASAETRIRTLMDRGFSRDAAARAIKRSDEERSAFVKFAFGVDWEDPALYDLVLNMDKLSVNLAVNTVVNLARSPEIAEASVDAIRSLEVTGLANRAEAALIEASFVHGGITGLSVSVVEPGRVRLTGTVEAEGRKVEAEEVLRAVRGVASVENEIRVVGPQRAV